MGIGGNSTLTPIRPYVVILTGGIASGKTAVSSRFERLGVPVIDTDIIAREVVQAGRPALTAIVDQFGKEVLDEKGELDRGRMRDLIFSDPVSKKKLENILHPAIGQEVRLRLDAIQGGYCILVVPLLAESGRYAGSDRVLVVDVDARTQLQRLVARDKISIELATAMLKAQASRQQRLDLANDVIENTGNLEALDREVASLHEKYGRLAGRNQAERQPSDPESR
ncbi:MAG: dephospho-CoA kinase [Xanthomonadales bacterium]|nr:dephospho-CoA kinase [Xanthomonadales bacterium]